MRSLERIDLELLEVAKEMDELSRQIDNPEIIRQLANLANEVVDLSIDLNDIREAILGRTREPAPENGKTVIPTSTGST